MKGTVLLIDYKYKKLSAALAGVGLLLALLEWKTQAIVFKKLPVVTHIHFCLWLMLCGLLCVAFCMEKVEDERVKQIRAKAMMQGFMITCAAVLGFSVNVSLFPILSPNDFTGLTFAKEDYTYMGMILMIFPAFSIISYLSLFSIGLYSDQHWQYDDISVADNFRKNKKYVYLRLLMGLLVMAGIMLIARYSK